MALQPSPTNLAGTYDTYSYTGCYLDNDAYTPAFRVLAAQGYPATNTNTIQNCIDACRRQRYAYAGLEFGEECWCDNQIAPGSSVATSEADCNLPCTGDPSQICGASARLSLYSGVLTSPITPSNIGNGYTFLGCYIDTDQARAVQPAAGDPADPISATINLEDCAAICAQNANYEYLGMTYFSQCFCGPVFDGTRGIDPTGCSLECTFQQGETCGGTNRMQVYQRAAAIEPPPVDPDAPVTTTTVTTTTTQNSLQSLESAFSSSSLAAYEASKSSVTSSRDAANFILSSSRAAANADSSSSRSAFYASKSLASSIVASSKASVTLSRVANSEAVAESKSSFRSSLSSANARISSSRSEANSRISAARALASESRSAAVASVLASKNSVSTSRSQARAFVTSSRAAASLSRSEANASLSRSRAEANARIFASRSEFYASRSASYSTYSSIRSARSAASAASLASALAPPTTTLTTTTAEPGAR